MLKHSNFKINIANTPLLIYNIMCNRVGEIMEEYINNIDIQTVPAQTLAFIGI